MGAFSSHSSYHFPGLAEGLHFSPQLCSSPLPYWGSPPPFPPFGQPPWTRFPWVPLVGACVGRGGKLESHSHLCLSFPGGAEVEGGGKPPPFPRLPFSREWGEAERLQLLLLPSSLSYRFWQQKMRRTLSLHSSPCSPLSLPPSAPLHPRVDQGGRRGRMGAPLLPPHHPPLYQLLLQSAAFPGGCKGWQDHRLQYLEFLGYDPANGLLHLLEDESSRIMTQPRRVRRGENRGRLASIPRRTPRRGPVLGELPLLANRIGVALSLCAPPFASSNETLSLLISPLSSDNVTLDCPIS